MIKCHGPSPWLQLWALGASDYRGIPSFHWHLLVPFESQDHNFLASILLHKRTIHFTPQGFSRQMWMWGVLDNNRRPSPKNSSSQVNHPILMALAAGAALPKLLHDPRRISRPKPIKRRNVFFARASSPSSSSSSSSVASEQLEGQLERPQWAGETPLSRLVGALISFKPLYSLMKLGARQVLIRCVSMSQENKFVQRTNWFASLLTMWCDFFFFLHGEKYGWEIENSMEGDDERDSWIKCVRGVWKNPRPFSRVSWLWVAFIPPLLLLFLHINPSLHFSHVVLVQYKCNDLNKRFLSCNSKIHKSCLWMYIP